MSKIRVATEDPARGNNLQRRLVLFHITNLNWRGMRTKQCMCVEIERIVHRSGRMVLGNVEGFEIVIVILDLRAIGNLESHLHEQTL